MGKMKEEFMEGNEGQQVPRDFLEHTEPCNEGDKWELLEVLERCQIENKNIARDLKLRILNVQYAAEVYELNKELWTYVDKSSWGRQKDINRVIDERTNRKNT